MRMNLKGYKRSYKRGDTKDSKYGALNGFCVSKYVKHSHKPENNKKYAGK